MPRNIALIAINTELSESNHHKRNNDDNNFIDNKCLALLDKYRDYLTVVCLNCNCKQNFANKLFVKYNELEKEYKNLFNDNNFRDNGIDKRSTNACNRQNDHIISDNKFGIDNERDLNAQCIVEKECPQSTLLTNANEQNGLRDNWDRFVFKPPVIDSQTIKSAQSQQQFLRKTESALNNTVTQQSTGETLNSKQKKTECEKNKENVSLNEKKTKFFNFHLIDTETKELSLPDNNYVTVLVSTKKQSSNNVVGYRCKWKNCDFINRYKIRAYEHVCITHTGVRAHKCEICKKAFFTKKEKKNHNLEHKKDERSADKNSVKPNKTDISLKSNQSKTTKSDLSAKPLELPVKHIGLKLMPQNDNDGKKMFNDLIVGTDTWEKPDKKFISAILLNKGSEPGSTLIGFRCTFPKCDFAHKTRKCVSSHVDKMHSPNTVQQKPQLITSQQVVAQVSDKKSPKKTVNKLEVNVSNDVNDNGIGSIRFNDILTFNDHIMGIDTIEKALFLSDKITAVISKKLKNNPLIGYRCRWPGCDYINRKLSFIQEHIIALHTGQRPVA